MKHSEKRTLEPGNPRRLSDARCAWRKMTLEQRAEFLAWVQAFEAGEVK